MDGQAAGLRAQDNGLALKGLLHKLAQHVEQRVQFGGGRQVAAEAVRLAGLCGAQAGGLGLLARLGRQRADHQAHNEQGREGQQV